MMNDELEKNVNEKNVAIDQKRKDDAVVNRIDVTRSGELMNDGLKNDELMNDDAKSNKTRNGEQPNAIVQAVVDM
jgi:hypothetical protein